MYLVTKMIEGIQKKETGTNHIWIYDRSGSMHYDLPRLAEDLVKHSSLLKPGDTLTLSWFSSEGGQYRTILKGFSITGTGNKEKIEKIVRQNMSSLGMTCFSEVLRETISNIEDVTVTNPENGFALLFFTDGHPVVRDYRKEEKNILEALGKLRPLIGEAMFIGYNQYYNRPFMSRMAEEIGGTLVHSDTMADVSENIEVFIKTGKSSKKITINLDDVEDVEIVFGTSTGKIVVYPYSKADRKAMVSDAESKIHVVSKDKKKKGKKDIDEDEVYVTAAAFAQQNKLDEAIEWLGKVGDVYLIDRLYNSFTTEELGEAFNELNGAAFDSSKRFLGGKKKNYVPKKDAFCLLEALETLTNDNEAYFYPYSDKFAYKRTGIKQVTKEGYPKFKADSSNRSPFASLTMNQKRLNLSVLTTVKGEIEIPEDGRKLGIADNVECFQWKNFTLVKDGMLNVRKLPCTMGKVSFLALRGGGLIPRRWNWKEGEVYILDLKKIPIMNRAIADSYNSAKAVAENAVEEKKLMAKMKTLKFLANKFETKIEVTPFTEQFDEKQIEYLMELGLKPNGDYNPPRERGESEDYYEATTFELKVKGWSSLPSVDNVVAKGKAIEEGDKKAKLNAPSEEIYGMFESFKDKGKEDLDKVIDKIKGELSLVRGWVQRAKFAVLLGKRSFKEFTEIQDVQTIELEDGAKVDFVFGKDRIEV